MLIYVTAAQVEWLVNVFLKCVFKWTTWAINYITLAVSDHRPKMKFMSHLNNISHYRSPSKHKKTPHTFSNRLPSTKSPIRTCATKFSLCTRTESRFHSLCRQRLSLIRTGSWPSSVTLHYMMKEWASERLSLSFPLLTKSTGSSTAKKFTSAQVSIRTERE